MGTWPSSFDNSPVELYRQRSCDALGVARHITDPDVKRIFVDLAAAWQRLADVHGKWSVEIHSQQPESIC